MLLTFLRGLRNSAATALLYTLGILSTLLFSALALLGALVRWRGMVRLMFRLWAGSLFVLTGRRIRIHGREHLRAGTSYLFVINHTSFMDIPALMLVDPGVHWIGREGLTRIPFFGQMLLATGYVPINLASPRSVRTSLERALDHGSRGEAVAIFPEGSRTHDGTMGPFKRGFVHLLRNCDLDLVPITVNGLYHFKPRNRWWLDCSQPLSLTIHAPMKNSDLRSLEDTTIIDTVHAVVASGLTVSQGVSHVYSQAT